MSIQAVGWAMKAQTGSAARKCTLVALANYADADGYAWPSQDTLAGDTELSVRTIIRALAELEADGWIERTARPRRADATRQSDLIRLVVEKRSTMVTPCQDDLPDTDGETILTRCPDQPDTLSPQPSGEPSLEPGEGARARPARATFLPENWKPTPQHVALAANEGLNAKQVEKAAKKFVLYHRETRRPSKDWDAAWARWVFREAEMLGVTASLDLTPAPTPQVFVPKGSRAWGAWQGTRQKPFPVTRRDGIEGWFFPSEWPPDHAPGHPNRTPAREVA